MMTSGFHLLQFQVILLWCRGTCWWYCFDWTCERFPFYSHQDFNLVASGSCSHALLPTVSWWLQVFTSDNFRKFKSGADGLVAWYSSDWTCEKISFLPTLGFEVGTTWISCAALYLLCNSDFLVFTSDNFMYWTLVQRDCWWYFSDWTYDRNFLLPHTIWIWNGDPLDL